MKAQKAAEAAAAASAAAAAERIAAAEAAAAESAALAAEAAEAAASQPASPGVVRIRRKKPTADGSIVPAGFVEEMAELSMVEQALANGSPMSSPLAVVPEETSITWLAGLGDAYPSEYAKLFKDNGVDLHFLVGLSVEELQEMGVKNNLHLKKMAMGIEKLRESGKYAAPPKVLQTQKEVVVAPVVVASTPTSAESSAAPATPSSPAVVIPDSPVGQFLYKLGPAFLIYLKTFEDNGVNLTFLLTLNDDDLEELGVSKLHRKKMVQEIKDLRSQSKESAPASAVNTAPTTPTGASAAAAVSAAPHGHSRTPSSGGGYLARAAAAKSGSATAAPIAASAPTPKDDILAAIKEAKEAKAKKGPEAAPADDIDLAGTSIAAIAQRMAAQREARAKAHQ